MCQHRTIGDEKHLVFDLRDKCPHLFEGTQADAIYGIVHMAKMIWKAWCDLLMSA